MSLSGACHAVDAGLAQSPASLLSRGSVSLGRAGGVRRLPAPMGEVVRLSQTIPGTEDPRPSSLPQSLQLKPYLQILQTPGPTSVS